MAENSTNNNDILEVEISKMVTTRFNVVTGMVEYSKGKNYQPMTDYVERSMLRSLKNSGHNIGVASLRNILNSDFSPPYNPFLDYFDSLPNWNGQTNYIEEFCNLVDVENNEHWIGWFTKWLVSLIAGAIDSNVVNQQVLVLAGGQGIGKTTWLNHIVPKKLDKYSSTGYLNPDSKDALIQASECILLNIDELSSLNNKNLEAFKQLVTQVKIRVRKPYGFNPENLVKRTSFCGSTNEEQFLIDTTGNRRFLCFKVRDIDLDRLSKFNIDNVFSQAYTLYKSGFKHWFDKKENKLIEESNLSFLFRSIEEEFIMERYEPCSKNDVGVNIFRWTATDVTVALSSYGLIPNSATAIQRVGKALVKLGFERYKSNGKMLYIVRVKQNLQVA